MRLLLILALLLFPNICKSEILLGGTDDNLSGSASLLLNSGTRYNINRLKIKPLGINSDQSVFFGGGYGVAGSSTIPFTTQIWVDRDLNLIAPSSGTLRLSPLWLGSSGSGSLPSYSINFGSGTNNGTIVISSSIVTTGSMSVNAGTLYMQDNVFGNNNLPFTLNNSGTLTGSGTIRNLIQGSGVVSPLKLITTSSIDPSNSLGFNFVFTSTTPNYSSMSNPNNDLLRLTGSSPFLADTGSGNSINIYLPSGVTTGSNYTGGFFVDSGSSSYPNFTSAISGANYKYYEQDNSGTVSYRGSNYNPLSGTLAVNVSSETVPSAVFNGPTVTNGQIATFNVVSAIVSWLLLTACSVGLSYWLMNKSLPKQQVVKNNINYSRSRPHKIVPSAPYRVVKYKPYSSTKNNTTLDYQPEKLNLPAIKPLFITQNKTIDIKEV